MARAEKFEDERSLPKGWRWVRFDEMAESITERVDNPSEAGVNFYVGLEHLDPDSLKIRRWGSPKDVAATKLRFTPGDIIFGRRRAYQRKIAVAEFEGICSAHALVLRAREEVVEKTFLPFFMQSATFFHRALSISVGSLSPTINWRSLASQEFALPPKAEQRRIVEILQAADQTIQNWTGVVLRLHELKEALAGIHFALGHDVARSKPVTELCERITVGIVVRPASYYVRKGGVPALRSLNVFPDRFELRELVTISAEGHAKHRKSQLMTGDVVVVRTGRPGDAAVVPEALAGSNCIDLIVVRPGSELNPGYLCRFLNSRVGRRTMFKGSAGTAQQHFNVTEFKKLRIPSIPIQEQRAVSGFFDVVDRQIEEVKTHLRQTREIRQAVHESVFRAMGPA